MTATTATPTTARSLLTALAPFGPAADGPDLVFATGPPPAMAPALRVLHTGVRAALTGRRWFGLDAAGRGCGSRADGALDPARPLPAAVALLTVEGDGQWDRVPASAKRDLPRLFAPTSRADRPRSGR